MLAAADRPSADLHVYLPLILMPHKTGRFAFKQIKIFLRSYLSRPPAKYYSSRVNMLLNDKQVHLNSKNIARILWK